ncbi:phosphoribosylformylglycinamidine cyclo-ligase [Candidatus Uhrbacteria bacterium]|nr:phosphoribosylformylglycinamidine cyclo-ligase [Candidatus Uhrbacteria bacterium]
MSKPMTYKGAGVDYTALDRFKRAAQKSAAVTDHFFPDYRIKVCAWSRGESAFLVQLPDGSILAHVEEGLGTKQLVADAMLKLQPDGPTYYGALARDTVAMIVNDMITVGVLPVTLAMHLAVGSDDWFANEQRSQDLIDGWEMSCCFTGCIWGGGETPTLRDTINPMTCVLAGSATGYLDASAVDRLISGQTLKSGQAIVMLASSGVHANGLTLCRKIAKRLPKGYLTPVGMDKLAYGELLLKPTTIYVPILRDLMRSGVKIHSAINVTGHGWRKLMRAPQALRYVIDKLPPEPSPIFGFIQKNGPVDIGEMYGNFNMGAGFAIIVDETNVRTVIEAADHHHVQAWHAGFVKDGSKQVFIRPLNLTFEADTLAVR